MQRAGMLLDVDGTLVDTNYLHTLAWSRAIRGAGEWAPMNAVHRLVGMGGENLLPELIGRDDPAIHEERKAEYRRLMDEVRVFPGARDLLHALHGSGLVLVLATSAPRDELQGVLDLLDVGDAIDATTSADDVDSSKPAPDVFLAALEAGNLDAGRSIVLGDSVWDVHAARAAGLGCVAVESGGFSAHELREAGALHVYRDVAEVASQFRTGPIGTLLGMVGGSDG